MRVIDPDMNLNPEAVDNFDVNVWSDSDVGGISLTVTETNAATGIFEGTVFFDDDSISSGHRLNVEEGDTVVAEYDDVTVTDRRRDLGFGNHSDWHDSATTGEGANQQPEGSRYL